MVLNKWKENQIKESQLTIEKYKLNLNKFKSAIMPDFLSETLVKAANLAQVNPDQAYEILLSLSRLLRYQLYENNSNLVNINKEIENLDLFLKLESVNKENFNYKINRNLYVENTKVAPMYFISLVKDHVFSNTDIEILIDQQMGISVVSNKSRLNLKVDGTEQI
jgi:LytS/YehU family sensor histidine kinase